MRRLSETRVEGAREAFVRWHARRDRHRRAVRSFQPDAAAGLLRGRAGPVHGSAPLRGRTRAQKQVQYRYPWAATYSWAAERQTIAIISEETIGEAISVPVDAIAAAVRDTSDRTPPAELAGDVMERGMVLTGEGALLRMLDERLAREPGIPLQVADDPLTRVAVGSGRFLQQFA